MNRHERRKCNARRRDGEVQLVPISDYMTMDMPETRRRHIRETGCFICGLTDALHSVIQLRHPGESQALSSTVCETCVKRPNLLALFVSCLEERGQIAPREPGERKRPKRYEGPTALEKYYDAQDLLLTTKVVRQERAAGMNAAIDAHYFGDPADDFNLETKASKRLHRSCERIFEDHYGEWFAEETRLINGEQTMVYDVPIEQADDCRKALTEAGFRLESAPITDEEMAEFYEARGVERPLMH